MKHAESSSHVRYNIYNLPHIAASSNVWPVRRLIRNGISITLCCDTLRFYGYYTVNYEFVAAPSTILGHVKDNNIPHLQ